jgi:hypothetical protein
VLWLVAAVVGFELLHLVGGRVPQQHLWGGREHFH